MQAKFLCSFTKEKKKIYKKGKREMGTTEERHVASKTDGAIEQGTARPRVGSSYLGSERSDKGMKQGKEEKARRKGATFSARRVSAKNSTGRSNFMKT